MPLFCSLLSYPSECLEKSEGKRKEVLELRLKSSLRVLPVLMLYKWKLWVLEVLVGQAPFSCCVPQTGLLS